MHTLRRHVLYAEQEHETSVGNGARTNVLALWLARRQRFLHGDDPTLARLLTLFWMLAKPTDATVLTKRNYVAFFQCVAKALVQSVNNDYAPRVATRDWLYDAGGDDHNPETTLSLTAFQDALLQCAELILPVESEVETLILFFEALRDAIASRQHESPSFRLRSLPDVLKIQGGFLQTMPPSAERLAQIRGLSPPDMDTMSLKQLLLSYNPRKWSLTRKFSSLFQQGEPVPVIDAPSLASVAENGSAVVSFQSTTPLQPSRLLSCTSEDVFDVEDATVQALETFPALRIAVVGPPGAGKSLVSTRLAQRLGLQYVSIGLAVEDAIAKKKQRDAARQERQRLRAEAIAASKQDIESSEVVAVDADAAESASETVHEEPSHDTSNEPDEPLEETDSELEVLLAGGVISPEQALSILVEYTRTTLLRGVGIVLDDVFPDEVANNLTIDFVVSLEMTHDDTREHITGFTLAPTSRRVYSAREQAMLTECDAVLKDRGFMDNVGFVEAADGEEILHVDKSLEQRRQRVADAVAAVQKKVVETPSGDENGEAAADEAGKIEPIEESNSDDTSTPPVEVDTPAKRQSIEPLDEPTVPLKALLTDTFDTRFTSFEMRVASLTSTPKTQVITVVATQAVADIVDQCVAAITNNEHGISRSSTSRAVWSLQLPEEVAATGSRVNQLRWLLYGDWTEMLTEAPPTSFAHGPSDPLTPRRLSRWRDCCVVSSSMSLTPVVGDPQFAAYFSGRVYLFASAKAREAFMAAPWQYLRQKPPLLPAARKLWVLACDALNDATLNALVRLVDGDNLRATEAIAARHAIEPITELREGKPLAPEPAMAIVADALGDRSAWVLTDLVYSPDVFELLSDKGCRPDAIIIFTADEASSLTPLEAMKRERFNAKYTELTADVPVLRCPLRTDANETQAALAQLLSPLTPRVDREDDGTQREAANAAEEHARVFCPISEEPIEPEETDDRITKPSTNTLGYDPIQSTWISRRRRMGETAQYCAVSWVTKRLLVPGQSAFVASFQQQLYAFAGASELAAFERNPSRYIPTTCRSTQFVVPVVWIVGGRGLAVDVWVRRTADAFINHRIGVLNGTVVARRVQRRLRAQVLRPLDQQIPLDDLYVDELAQELQRLTSQPDTYDIVLVANISTATIATPPQLDDDGQPSPLVDSSPLPTPELLALCFARDLFPTLVVPVQATEDFVVSRQLREWKAALPPPPRRQPATEEEPDAIDTAALEADETTRLQEQFQTDQAALVLALETLRTRGVMVDPAVDITLSSRAVVQRLVASVASLVARKASLFEVCERVSFDDAVQLLRSGEVVVGKHAMCCPVTSAATSPTTPALTYRGRLYFPQSPAALTQCEQAPASMLVDSPSQRPQCRISCAVVGPPGVGKTRLCRQLVHTFGLVYVSPRTAMEWVRQCLGPQVSLWSKLHNTSDGKSLDPAVIHEAIATRLCSADCQRRGWVLDDYMGTADELARCLDSTTQSVHPGVVFVLEGTTKPELSDVMSCLVTWQTYRLDLIRIWTTTFGAFHVRQIDTDTNSAWQTGAHATAILQQYTTIARQYAQSVAMGRPVRMQGVLRPHTSLMAAVHSTYQTFCPVELGLNRYYSTTPTERERCIELEDNSGQRVILWLATDHHIEQVCASGGASFWADDIIEHAKQLIAKDPVDASILSLLSVADCEFPEMKGYCPVTFANGTGDADWQAIVKGSVFYRVSYENQVFFCRSETERRAFITCPSRYAHHVLPIKLPPSLTMPLAFKNCPGRIEQELASVLNETLLKLGAVRPKFLGVAMDASACFYLALLLKTRAVNGLPDHIRMRYVERLREFERDCRVGEQLKRLSLTTASCGSGIKGARGVRGRATPSLEGDGRESTVDEAESLRERFDELTMKTTNQQIPRAHACFLDYAR